MSRSAPFPGVPPIKFHPSGRSFHSEFQPMGSILWMVLANENPAHSLLWVPQSPAHHPELWRSMPRNE
jgi:hypothetical protein